MNEDSTLVPDLLRRFVATPYVADNSECGIRIQSNDSELLAQVYRVNDKEGACAGGFFWHIVRDMEAPPHGPEVAVLHSGELSAVVSGGMIVWIDVGRREVLGFLPSTLSTSAFASEVCPLIFQTIRTRHCS